MGEAKRKKQRGASGAADGPQAEVRIYCRDPRQDCGLYWWMTVDPAPDGDVHAGPPTFGQNRERFKLTQHQSGIRNLHGAEKSTRIEATEPLHRLNGMTALGTWQDHRVDWTKRPMPEEEAKRNPKRIERILKWPPSYVLLYALEPGHRAIWEPDGLLECLELIHVDWTTPRHYAVAVLTTLPGPLSGEAMDSLPRGGGGLSVFVGAWQKG